MTQCRPWCLLVGLIFGCSESHEVDAATGFDAAIADTGSEDAATPDGGHGHDHFYSSIEEAYGDGLVVYVPFSARHEGVGEVWDEGAYAQRPIEFGGRWHRLPPDIEERHGPLVEIGAADALALINPLARGPVTILAIVASPALIGGGGDASAFDVWIPDDERCERGLSASVAVGLDGAASCASGRWCATATGCGGVVSGPLEADATTVETTGLVYAFFVWDGERIVVDLDGSSSAARASPQRLSSAGPLRLGGRAAGRPTYITSFAMWDRALSGAERARMRSTDAEIADGY